jgi:hypothetical protein
LTEVVEPVAQLLTGHPERLLQVMSACVIESPRAAIRSTCDAGFGGGGVVTVGEGVGLGGLAAFAAEAAERVPVVTIATATRVARVRRTRMDMLMGGLLDGVGEERSRCATKARPCRRRVPI